MIQGLPRDMLELTLNHLEPHQRLFLCLASKELNEALTPHCYKLQGMTVFVRRRCKANVKELQAVVKDFTALPTPIPRRQYTAIKRSVASVLDSCRRDERRFVSLFADFVRRHPICMPFMGDLQEALREISSDANDIFRSIHLASSP